jgi:hypothetical protein
MRKKWGRRQRGRAEDGALATDTMIQLICGIMARTPQAVDAACRIFCVQQSGFQLRDWASGVRRMGMAAQFFRRLPGWMSSVLLGTVPLPGWAMLALAIIIGVPDWKERYEFWLGVSKSTGPWFAPVIPILAHPYFPGALALTGFFYLIVVGYSGSSVIRHTLLPFVAWAVVGVCIIAVGGTAVAGYFELRARQEGEKIALGIPRGASPAENNPDKPQRPLKFGNGQDIQPDQLRILKEEIPKIHDELQNMTMAVAPPETGPRVNPQPFQLIFSRSGLNSSLSFVGPRGPEDQGLNNICQ